MSFNPYNNDCPICDNDRINLIPTLKGKYLKCPRCDLTWSATPVNPKILINHYETEDPSVMVSQSRASIYSSLLKSAIARLGNHNKILDVGCSIGAFIKLAAANGWQVHGIEPAINLAKIAQDTGLKVTTGVLTQLPDEWGKFDLITYWDSFMLTDNPRLELERALSRLHENGWIFLRLRQHNIQRLLNCFWRFVGRHFRIPNPSVYHPFNFTPKTIRILAERYHLVHEITYSSPSEGDPYDTVRLHFIVQLVKTVSAWVAEIINRISKSRFILSPGMDIWLSRTPDNN